MRCTSKFRVVGGSCGGGISLSLVVRPLSEAVFAPQISVARATSSGKMSQFSDLVEIPNSLAYVVHQRFFELRVS